MFRIFIFLLFLISFASCNVLKPLPQPKTEFRGVWVATVVNIDWPKSGTDEIKKQKKDFLDILEFYDDMNFNAIIVQVRTAGDAFYDSKFAPWSRFLTGNEGNAPKSKEDILEWMITESHNRGIEFHAWLNPYRATFDLNSEVLSPLHDYNLHPEWMLKYGKKYYYNPGLPEVRERLVAIMDEIVTKYDVDAIHFDDYFYPYKIKDEVFKDSLSYSYHSLPGQSIDNWRRSNIDSLVKNIHKTVKSKKPWVQFGISPFGVWKNKSSDPKGSDTKAGQTTYEDLYADPLTWMKNGWIDYLVPQVYWSMDLEVASHSKIVKWWSTNSEKTNLYIGNGPYKIRNNSDAAWDNPKELPKQLSLSRNDANVQGNVMFSAKSLMLNNDDVVTILKKKFYKHKALTPTSPITPELKILTPLLKEVNHEAELIQLQFNDLKEYRYAIIYTSGKRVKKEYPIKKMLAKRLVKNDTVTIERKSLTSKKQIAISFIDYYGRETKPIFIQLNKTKDDSKR